MERYATGIGMIAKEANAVGIPFEITPGHYAALSVGAIASRLDAARRMEVAQIMKDVLRQAGVSPFLNAKDRKPAFAGYVAATSDSSD